MANKPQKCIVKIDNVEEIKDALITHGECYVSNLGKFIVTDVVPRPRYNFATKKTENFPMSKRVVFNINKAVKELL